MRIYISSHCHEMANFLADKLRAKHQICSLWHQSPLEKPQITDSESWGNKAVNNCYQIKSADVLILTASDNKVAGGKFFEAGYALASGLRVVILGRVENGMMWHTSISRVANIEELLKYLG